MIIKILVQEANKLIYFIRFNPNSFKKRPHKIVAYAHEFCKVLCGFRVFRWEFEQTTEYAKTFRKLFDVWGEDDL